MLYSIYIPSRKNWLLDIQLSAPFSGSIRDFQTTSTAPLALVMTHQQAVSVVQLLEVQYHISARVMVHKYSTDYGRLRKILARLIEELYVDRLPE